MAYVIPQCPVPAAAVLGTDELFPVHGIYCVGRNYAEHAREMGDVMEGGVEGAGEILVKVV